MTIAIAPIMAEFPALLTARPSQFYAAAQTIP
jgi:hypothetical protein